MVIVGSSEGIVGIEAVMRREGAMKLDWSDSISSEDRDRMFEELLDDIVADAAKQAEEEGMVADVGSFGWEEFVPGSIRYWMNFEENHG